MKKILLSIATIALVSVVAVKATGAFFTDKEISEKNTFTAGTLTVDINDQNSTEPFASEILATNWQPGEERFVNFDVLNTGSLPVKLRGFASGTWSLGGPDHDVTLDPTKVQVMKIERYDGGWIDVITTGPVLGYFYYSSNGADASLFDVAPGQRAQLRLTVVLDDDAGNDYQSAVFTSTIQVEARQTTSGATWPL